MKKNYFLGAAAAFGLFALASCSNEDDPITQQPGEEIATGEQVIVLDMQDTDVLSTKSRPLYSTTNQGAELVTDVKLLVYSIDDATNKKTFVKTISVPNWRNTSTDYSYGRQRTIKLSGDDKLESDEGTKFTIIAVGQDEESAIPAPFKVNGQTIANLVSGTGLVAGHTWNSSTTPGTGVLKTDELDYSTGRVSEIFSGQSQPITVELDGGFSANVILKRQVAGVLGYFNRIPAWVGSTGSEQVVQYIRLVSSARNKQVDLTIQLDLQKDDATSLPGEATENVVNGFTADATADAKFKSGEDAYTVYQIDLTKWFDKNASYTGAKDYYADDALIEGENGVKLLGGVDGWVNPLRNTNDGPTVADGAVLAGEFVIPFNKDESASNNTFELQLLGTDGSTVLKAWNVKLDAMSQGAKDSEYFYNIYRNHLYQIGQRGGGDNPTDPGEDPDKPQPLDKDQELTIKINDNWEFIHDMEIE